MKTLIGIIIVIIVASFALFLLPLTIGIIVAYFKITGGNILGGIIAIVVGIICQLIWHWYITNDGISVDGDDEDCPYCGGGDTDGNHCFTCDEEF